MSSSLNWLDRTVNYFSPSRGLRRAQARAAMGVMLDYDGAKRDRRTDGWWPGSLSGDAEAGLWNRDLRDSARSLVRDNPHAAKGLAVLVSNRIGTGIMCQPDGANARRNKRTAELWKRWIDNCDLTGRSDWYGLQAQIERTRIEAGECLYRFVNVVSSSYDDIPLRIQVLEPDYLDSDKHEEFSETHSIRHGVEYENNVAVAYWIYQTHPGDTSLSPFRRGFKSTRVPASEIRHVFKPLRPGQGRGVSEFAPVIKRLKGLDDYDVAEVMRKRIAACTVAAVTTPASLPGASIAPTTVDEDGNRIESMRPGMMPYLKPGESIEFFDPKPSGDYGPFNQIQLRAVAAGLGMPYELLTGDLSEVNYTSHRGGLVQFRGMVEAEQWHVIVPQVCAPVVYRWTEEAARLNKGVDPNTSWTYTPPRFGLLDPAKEIPAMVQSLQAGIESYSNLQRREGYDPLEKLDEIKDFIAEAEARGLDGLLEYIWKPQAQAAQPAQGAMPDSQAA